MPPTRTPRKDSNTLTYTGTGSAIEDVNNGNLTINNSTRNAGAVIIKAANGTGVKQTGSSFTLTDNGKIEGKIGADIQAGNFTMNGGTIECTGTGAVKAVELMGGTASTFVMNGGNITAVGAASGENTPSGIGVFGKCSFTMNDGRHEHRHLQHRQRVRSQR